jgi:VanZ family protein
MMKLKYTFPIIIYALALIVASVLPSGAALNEKKIGVLFELRLDYFVHCCAYMGFYFLIIVTNLFKREVYPTKNFLHVFIGTLLLAIGTEVVQLFLSYRTFNLFDILANVSGIFIGVIILYFTSKYRIISLKLRNWSTKP